MNSINGAGNNLPLQQVQNISGTAAANSVATAKLSSPSRGSDHLELSGANQASKAGGIQSAKVAAIKSQIANGTYEDDHKLNVAIDRLLTDLNK